MVVVGRGFKSTQRHGSRTVIRTPTNAGICRCILSVCVHIVVVIGRTAMRTPTNAGICRCILCVCVHIVIVIGRTAMRTPTNAGIC